MCPSTVRRGIRAERVLRRAAQSERGAVTAELAVVMPAVVVLLALLLTGAAAGMAQVRVEGAARTAARALARGDAEPAAAALALAQTGPGAHVAVSGAGALVHVRVEQRVPVIGGVVLPLSVVAEASGPWENPAQGAAVTGFDRTASGRQGVAAAGAGVASGGVTPLPDCSSSRGARG
ncbi:TadE family type IV pilus minor pilin [Tersicoccus sp. MR15.9]|uniref:TadE family type IV pilus minor pilin n=1 Tax=Tersicoccus mangrovi TaxID=3121635 RepID=UPI002FE62C40